MLSEKSNPALHNPVRHDRHPPPPWPLSWCVNPDPEGVQAPVALVGAWCWGLPCWPLLWVWYRGPSHISLKCEHRHCGSPHQPLVQAWCWAWRLAMWARPQAWHSVSDVGMLLGLVFGSVGKKLSMGEPLLHGMHPVEVQLILPELPVLGQDVTAEIFCIHLGGDRLSGKVWGWNGYKWIIYSYNQRYPECSPRKWWRAKEKKKKEKTQNNKNKIKMKISTSWLN